MYAIHLSWRFNLSIFKEVYLYILKIGCQSQTLYKARALVERLFLFVSNPSFLSFPFTPFFTFCDPVSLLRLVLHFAWCCGLHSFIFYTAFVNITIMRTSQIIVAISLALSAYGQQANKAGSQNDAIGDPQKSTSKTFRSSLRILLK